jgi:hypothetical protein
MRVPYLEHRPDIVTVDVGRQLFVDDFLVERTSLTRTFHRPEPHPGNPLLKPKMPWEAGDVPFAMPFSDGVWHDPADGLFKLWYTGNEMWSTCYAESDDGIHWRRPELDVVPGTNIVCELPRDSSTVWLDHLETDPARRFKMFLTVKQRRTMGMKLLGYAAGNYYTYTYLTSPDGIHWSVTGESPRDQPIGDRSTVFYDPFRRRWVFSIRDIEFTYPAERREQDFRIRLFRDHPEIAAGMANLTGPAVPWVGADDIDPPHPDYPDRPPQLYTLDAIAYESLMLGYFSIHQGPENPVCIEKGMHKRNQLALGFSRDGFHWHRPDRRPFIAAHSQDPDAWDWGNIQSVGGGCLVVGDHLYFYYSGRRNGSPLWDAGGATGLAILRRDGFASFDADRDGGYLLTRPIAFSGRHLFVNTAVGGRLRVAVIDEHGVEIDGYGLRDCRAIEGDGTAIRVRWADRDDVGELAGRRVQLRFELFDGSLYAFWISPWASGESNGYLAAGGPGARGPIDRPSGQPAD